MLEKRSTLTPDKIANRVKNAFEEIRVALMVTPDNYISTTVETN